MRGRRTTWASILVALVAVLSCTDDGPSDDDASDDADSTTTTVAGVEAGPLTVPAAFAHRPATRDGWAVLGATADALVGFGGEAARAGAYGRAVDLTTGEVVAIDAPPPDLAGRRLTLNDAAFGDDTVLVTGFLPSGDGSPPATDRPAPVEVVAFRLDPLAGSWTEVVAPDVTSGIGRFANLRPVRPNAGAVGWLSSGAYSQVALVAFDGDAWQVVSTTDQGDVRAAALGCTTSTTGWSPAADEQGAWDGLTATDLSDGSERAVGVPGIEAPSNEQVAVACADGAVLAAQQQGDGVVVQVSADDGATWDEVTSTVPPGDGPARIEQSRDDGAGGAVLRLHRDDGVDVSLVVLPDGEVVPLGVESLATPVLWQGTTGMLLAIESVGDDATQVRRVPLP